MLNLNQFHNAALDYQVVACDGELATIQVQVPVSFAATLPALLGSLQSTLALMSQRVRVANAVAKAADPVEIEKRKERALQHERTVLARFDKFRAASCSVFAPSSRGALVSRQGQNQRTGLVIRSASPFFRKLNLSDSLTYETLCLLGGAR